MPAAIALTLIIIWTAHDGGFDEDTWYWGALVLLATLAAVLTGGFGTLSRLGTPIKVALSGFAVYVAWSYASIAWANYQGIALSGSNRALMYLLLFALLAMVRWTPRRALWMLVAWAVAVGVIAAVTMLDLARGDQVASLVTQGRLMTPLGYFNANAALFMMMALVAVSLAVRREIPALLGGLLLAMSCAGLQLALLAQSRGWLFTLPLVVVVGLIVTRDRLAVTVAAILPAAGLLVVLTPLLDVYRVSDTATPSPAAVTRAAEHAGRTGLVSCAVVLVLGTVAAWLWSRTSSSGPPVTVRRIIGTALTVLILALGAVAGSAATHGHPVRFLNRQWHGFTHPTFASNPSASHFAAVGTERYDAWRVAFKAFLAHPIGGLGQDNFADYYILHRRTTVDLLWTHSLGLRMLAHTGLVGTLAFAVFLVGALVAAIRTRRANNPLGRAVAGTALLPLIVWLIHGSLDWFWEIPALSGPALGFLALAGSATAEARVESSALARGSVARRVALAVLGGITLVAAVVVLAFPYLSVREVSIGNDLSVSNPSAALAAFHRAAKLNPLNADPGRLGGATALRAGDYQEAETRFRQAIAREPGGWFPWLGAGLAASALGQRAVAKHDFKVAASINSQQPAVTTALARVDSSQPLTPQAALDMLVLVQ